jgi:hypothetical protein
VAAGAGQPATALCGQPGRGAAEALVGGRSSSALFLSAIVERTGQTRVAEFAALRIEKSASSREWDRCEMGLEEALANCTSSPGP